MANIPLLQNGCTGADIINTINAIIARLNDGGGISISYNDLTNKPRINGVELEGNKTTSVLLIAMSGTSDYETLMASLATKAYADNAKTDAVAAAQAAVRASLDNKLDKDLGNLESVESFNGEAMVPIATSNGTKKTKLSSLAFYTELQAQAVKSAADASVDKYRKIIQLTGEQNGSNVTFGVTGGYKTGTSCLYFNGVLQAVGRDYDETDSETITTLSFVPEEEDILIFKAIPLE